MYGGRGVEVRNVVRVWLGFPVFALLLTSAFAGIVGAGAEAGASAQTIDVNLLDSTFSTTSVTIEKGDSIRFVNKAAFCHTVTRGAAVAGTCSGSGSKAEADFDVVLASVSEEVTITFTMAGTVNVYCRPHAQLMLLTIAVQEPGSTPPPKSTSGFEAFAMFGALLGAAAVIGVILSRRRGGPKYTAV